MFEHLTNDFESYRNRVIEANKKLYNISTMMKTLIENKKFIPQATRENILKEYLQAQEELNNLYRMQPTY